jgi:hypothetical protein
MDRVGFEPTTSAHHQLSKVALSYTLSKKVDDKGELECVLYPHLSDNGERDYEDVGAAAIISVPLIPSSAWIVHR